MQGEEAVLDGATWFKSSDSGAAGHCVEAAFVANSRYVGVRNSRQPDGPALIFSGRSGMRSSPERSGASSTASSSPTDVAPAGAATPTGTAPSP